MKIRKWVDMGAEVDVEVGVDDVRGALNEAFANVTDDRLGEEGPNRNDVIRTFEGIGKYLSAISDEHIAMLNDSQRELISNFLAKAAERVKNPEPGRGAI